MRVWINCALHDIRVRHVSAAWREVEPEEVLSFAAGAPPNRYVFQGVAGYPMNKIMALRRPGVEMRFEISRLTDYGEQFEQMRRAGAGEALVLGSEFPFRELRGVAWVAARSCGRGN